MKKNITIILLFLFITDLNAQKLDSTKSKSILMKNEKYFSFNPFGIAEPEMAIGLGFGIRVTNRSEYFLELSNICKTPFYQVYENSVNGFRFIAQYRYHFMQQFQTDNPFLLKGLNRRRKRQSFVAFELKLKSMNFTDKVSLLNWSTMDTIRNFNYRANAVAFGAAILFGNTFNLSANNKWKLEFTLGLGLKNKFLRNNNVHGNYGVYDLAQEKNPIIPSIYATGEDLYIPCALRIKYLIR